MMWRTMTAVAASVLLATAATAGPTLTATAGLGGMVRASRWTPVRVLLTATDAGTTGDLEVAWGSATIRRRLVFDSAGTRRMDFHIRTPDAEPQIRVRFSQSSGPTASIEVPVQVARDVDRIEVCVVPEQTEIPDDSTCSTRVTPADLPVSLRGYEAADAVLWPVGRIGLAPAQDDALAQWEALKRLDANAIERTMAGEDVGTESATWTLSADRKRLTVLAKGTDSAGVAYVSTQVYERQ